MLWKSSANAKWLTLVPVAASEFFCKRARALAPFPSFGGERNEPNPQRTNMRTTILASLSTLCLAATAAAQMQEGLLSFSQTENTLSGSGGTVLQTLRPNEVATLEWGTIGCNLLSAEKWLPRTCSHVMAGDENADGMHFNPAIFGTVDALVTTIPIAGTGFDNQRTVFWSPSAAMGNNISGNPFRPGDVARIVRAGLADGQVEYFMSQQQFNTALGLAPATPIDVDAIAISPQFGVFFSLDGNVFANTACGPMAVLDGAILAIPPAALAYTPDMRIAGVLPNSAIVVYTEAQVNAMVVNAGVTDRFGACVPAAIDTESLEFDFFGPVAPLFGCTAGLAVFAPPLIFSVEAGTGASMLSTLAGGSIWNSPCWPMGRNCGTGPTMGTQSGLRPPTPVLGVASYVNAFTWAHHIRYVLEPQNHVLTVFPAGAPAGSTNIDIGSPFPWNLVFIEVVSPVVPASLPAFPFSQMGFPDIYVPSLLFYLPTPTVGGFSTFPMPAIPPMFAGKVLFQSVGISAAGTFELSTPTVIDVQ